MLTKCKMKKMIDNITKFISRHKYEELILLISFGIVLFYFFNLYFRRWDIFTAIDLNPHRNWTCITSNFNMLRRSPIEFLMSLINRKLLIMQHLAPSIFLFFPFYMIFPSIKTLYFLKIFLILISAYPLFLLSKERIGDKKISLLLSLIYLLFPLTFFVIINPVTDIFITFAFPFFISSFYFFERRRFKYFAIFSIITIFFKENFTPIFLFFGIYSLIKRKQKKWGTFLIIISILNLVFFFSMTGFYSTYEANLWKSNYDVGWGEFNLGLFKRISRPEVPIYFNEILKNYLYLPIFSPGILFITIPKFMEIALLKGGLLRTSGMFINEREFSSFVPLFFIGTVYALYNLKKILKKFISKKSIVNSILIFLIIAMLVSSIATNVSIEDVNMEKGLELGFYSNDFPNQYLVEDLPRFNPPSLNSNYTFESRLSALENFRDEIPEGTNFSSDPTINSYLVSDIRYRWSSGGELPDVKYLIINTEFLDSKRTNLGLGFMKKYHKNIQILTEGYKRINESKGISLYEKQ